MKSERLELLLTILLCLLIIFTYGRFNEMHLKLMQERIDNLNMMIGRLSSLQAGLDASLKTSVTALRQVNEKLASNDQSRADIVAKLESLANEIEALSASKQAKKAVELEPIAVKKPVKAKK